MSAVALLREQMERGRDEVSPQALAYLFGWDKRDVIRELERHSVRFSRIGTVEISELFDRGFLRGAA